MEYKGYIARVEFDDEAGIFHGEVINPCDVITFQGRSVEELRRALEDSVEDYLEFCRARGEEPERPFSSRFVVRLTPEQHRKIYIAARRSGKSINAWVAEALEKEAEEKCSGVF